MIGVFTRLLVLFACAVAIGATGYLSFVLPQDLAGCEGVSGADCGEVLTTRWSRWFGLPVSVLGIGAYALLAMAILTAPRHPSRARWGALLTLGMMNVAAGVWFTGLQVIVIDSFCPYCLTAHGAGLVALLALLAAYGKPDAYAYTEEGGWSKPQLFARSFVVAALLIAMFIGGQVQDRFTIDWQFVDRQAEVTPVVVEDYEFPLADPVPNNPQPEAGPLVVLADGKLEMRLGEYPIIGSPDAPNIMALMYDYTCPACRSMRTELVVAQQKYPGQFAVVLFPVALDSNCNPVLSETAYTHRNACLFGKMAIALWNTDRAAFANFDQKLINSAVPPEAGTAWAWATEGLSEERLVEAMDNPMYDKMLDFSINLFYAPLIERKVLPVLVMPKSIRLGNPDTRFELHDFLEAELDLTPPVLPEQDGTP